MLAFGVLQMDLRFDGELSRRFPSVFHIEASGAYSILSVIAQSMMTVAGVTFSITVVALSLAANQYSPRTLRNYMRDRGNQVVLGVFLGAFSYSLIILRVVRGGSSPFVPSIAVVVGILLAIVGVGVFIYFIHHVSASLVASHIVEAVAIETRRSLEKLYGDTSGDSISREAEVETGSIPQEWQDVPALKDGYLQAIDLGEVTRFAETSGRVVAIAREVGSFVTKSDPMLRVSGTQALDDRTVRDLNDMAVIRSYRTTRQDPAFGIRQIVDVALKALSPGINDTTTALTCVDYLGAVLSRFAADPEPGRFLYAGGALRIVTRETPIADLIRQGFHPIIRNASGNADVLAAALQAADEIFGRASGEDRLGVLRDIVVRIGAAADAGIKLDPDREWVTNTARAILNRHAGNSNGSGPD